MEKPRIISVLNPSSLSKTRDGYALVVVLFSLTILTLIFGTSTSRTIAHIERTRTDAVLAQRQHDGARMAELVMQIGLAGLDPEAGERPAVFDGVILQPVTGLVDLNTASPALLQLLLEGYGLPDAVIREGLVRYRDWRRRGRKLLRVSDFKRITGLTEEMLSGLEKFATIYSGRTGIAAAQVQLELLQHLVGEAEDSVTLLQRLDPALLTTAALTNHSIALDGTERAVVHLSGASSSRFLSTR